MLPFPIISDTNVVVYTSIKDIQSWYSNLFQTIVLLSDGSFYTSGYNVNGQLGVGDKVNRFNVLTNIRNDVRLMSCNNVSTIIVNSNNTYLYTPDSRLYGCGNKSGGFNTIKSSNVLLFEEITLTIN